MTATMGNLGSTRRSACAAIGGLPSAEILPVEGTLPAGLDGCFLQACPHPASPVIPDAANPAYGSDRTGYGPTPLFSGVRLGGGLARWYRAGAAVRRGRPFEPVPALAPSVWLVDSAAASQGRPGHASAARPVRAAASPFWHTITTYPGRTRAAHVITAAGGSIVHAESFPLDGAPLMHAVALTERFVVVLDLPVTYSRAAAMIGVRFPYSWQPNRPARIGLLPRWPQPPAAPRWFAIDPCYVFHAVNAYDDGDRVVLDAVKHARAFDATPDSAKAPARVYRWTLDLATGSVCARQLLPGVLDVATVDGRVSGQPTRFVFGAGPGVLVGHDLATGHTRVRELGAGLRAGQPVFVPRHRHSGVEGDGWILALTENFVHGRAALLVLDALHLDGPPQAVVHIPFGLPASLRATWLAAA